MSNTTPFGMSFDELVAQAQAAGGPQTSEGAGSQAQTAGAPSESESRHSSSGGRHEFR